MDAIEAVPERDRIISRIEGLNYAEISERFDISIEASRLRQIQSLFRKNVLFLERSVGHEFATRNAQVTERGIGKFTSIFTAKDMNCTIPIGPQEARLAIRSLLHAMNIPKRLGYMSRRIQNIVYSHKIFRRLSGKRSAVDASAESSHIQISLRYRQCSHKLMLQACADLCPGGASIL